MIPKRRKRAKMGVRPPERVRSPGHLAWVRGHACAAFGNPPTYYCGDRIESHHVRVEGDGTTGKKPSDEHVVPLCNLHHEEGHRIGWKSFEARYKVDLTKIAAELWKRSPHGIKYRREHDQ